MKSYLPEGDSRQARDVQGETLRRKIDPRLTSVSSRQPRDYIWPDTVRRPSRPPRLIYLDLNHWVALSKAQVGHPDGMRYRDALDACTTALAKGVAVFPLSGPLYMEIEKISQHRKRRNLREVIEPLSRYRVVVPRSVVGRLELDAVLDALVGPSPIPFGSIDYLDQGVMRAMGLDGTMRVRDSRTNEDVTDKAQAEFHGGPEAFDRMLGAGRLQLERNVIDGPKPDEVEEMRSAGWDPLASHVTQEARAQQERDQAARLDPEPHWRTERVRDVVSVREVVTEYSEPLYEGLRARGSSLDEVFGDRIETIRDALDSMPTFDVAVSIKAALHRNTRHPWTANDITDIDAIASTVPYCDVVVVDRAMAGHLHQTGVADRLETTVYSNVDDLAADLTN